MLLARNSFFPQSFSSELIQGEEKRHREGGEEGKGLKEGGERDNEGEEVREGRGMD